jgi:hypothetical protein
MHYHNTCYRIRKLNFGIKISGIKGVPNTSKIVTTFYWQYYKKLKNTLTRNNNRDFIRLCHLPILLKTTASPTSVFYYIKAGRKKVCNGYRGYKRRPVSRKLQNKSVRT